MIVSNNSNNGTRVFRYKSLDFTGAGKTLTIAAVGPGASNGSVNSNVFSRITVNNNGTLDIRNDFTGTAAALAKSTAKLGLSNITVQAGRLLTITDTGSNPSNGVLVGLAGTLAVGLAGSADFLSTNSFKIVDYVANANGKGSLTDGTTFDTTANLWVKSTVNSDIFVTLSGTANLGTINAAGGGLSFGAANAGYLTLTNLAIGSYEVNLTLATGASTNQVAQQLALNPAYSGITFLTETNVFFTFASSMAGTGYFAWDNVNSLGGDLTGFQMAIPEPSAIALVGLGMLTLLTLRRRRRP